ncbi:putative HNHc nuclease [Companilactobacillus sp. FL22-1]|uniref:putative HNHc nuclease n=1 Tax=Companilactobacillus sp. FL22-1 TaxID=3373892 RepID=UPI0037544B96
MKFLARIKSIQGNNITLEMNDEINNLRVAKLANGKQPLVEMEISDNRHISIDQRIKIYALIGEISDWSGYMVEKEAPGIMKWKYLIETGRDEFSLSDCTMTQANSYLSWLLDFCFDNNVPFSTKTWDMLPNDYAMQLRCLEHRKCCICGRHADVAHVEAVGSGRNRRKINHSEFHFMALCRVHHIEQHKMGIMSFLQKYHIKPIKLDDEDRKKLRIGG